jgi:ParB-like chromosome segregation protein Spo0J
MSGAMIPKPQLIGLGIDVKPERLRALRPDVVAELVQSMRERGQLQPIIVRPNSQGTGYWLVAGRHRLEAARKLKWDSINALVFEGMNADEAELAEIEENLIRADLSPAERALHQARRKELYESLHPETKHGGDRKSVKQSSSQNENLKAFVDATAARTGKGRSTIARDVTRAKQVAVLDQIVGTSLDQGGEIDALAKLPEKEQRTLAERARNGEKVSAKPRPAQEDAGAARLGGLSSLTGITIVEILLELERNIYDVDAVVEFLLHPDNAEYLDRSRRGIDFAARLKDALNAAGLGNKTSLQVVKPSAR